MAHRFWDSGGLRSGGGGVGVRDVFTDNIFHVQILGGSVRGKGGLSLSTIYSSVVNVCIVISFYIV